MLKKLNNGLFDSLFDSLLKQFTVYCFKLAVLF